jgi:hypothetical protein
MQVYSAMLREPTGRRKGTPCSLVMIAFRGVVKISFRSIGFGFHIIVIIPFRSNGDCVS